VSACATSCPCPTTTTTDNNLKTKKGVLYYGDVAGGGVLASDFITELTDQAGLDAFIAAQPPEVLTVVDVSLSGAAPCVRVYPAVLALARSFKGFAAFARLQGDAGEAAAALLQRYNVLEVPTFLFFKGGKEVARHVGSSRGDLIGRILEVQAQFGVAPPPPPPRAAQPVKKRVIKRRV
jgi:thioredoxin-like negative regulator of GroEL